MIPNPVLTMVFRGEGCSNGWLPDWLPALREYFSLWLVPHSEANAELDAEATRPLEWMRASARYLGSTPTRASYAVSQDAKIAAAGTASTLLPILPIAASVAEFALRALRVLMRSVFALRGRYSVGRFVATRKVDSHGCNQQEI